MAEPNPAATPASFATFFRRRLLPVLSRMERIRRLRLAFGAVVMALCCLATIYLLAVIIPRLWWLWLIPLALPAGVVFGLQILLLAGLLRSLRARIQGRGDSAGFIMFPVRLWEAYKEFLAEIDDWIFRNSRRRERYLVDIIVPTAHFARPGLVCVPKETVERRLFLESGLFGERFNRYAGGACFSGVIKNAAGQDCYLKFSWVRVEHYPYFRFDGNYRQLFNGWFFVVDFSGWRDGQAMILPRSGLGGDWLGNPHNTLDDRLRPPEILVESLDFERYFSLHAKDRYKAAPFANPDFLRAVTVLRSRLKAPLALSLRNRRLYLAFPAPVEHFTILPTVPLTAPTFSRHLYLAVRGAAELVRLL